MRFLSHSEIADLINMLKVIISVVIRAISINYYRGQGSEVFLRLLVDPQAENV